MKKALVAFSWVLRAFFLASLIGRLTLVAENPPKITVIDNASRVKLASSTHPLVVSATDLGRVDPTSRLQRMLLILGPSQEIQPGLNAFIDSLHDKRSPNYHQWLTPQQFGERFGPSQADVNKIVAWLQQQGFDSAKVSPGRGHIEFAGQVQLVERTFQTQMHSYQRGTETHLANNSDISIPRALAGVVRGISLQNFTFSKPALVRPTPLRHDTSTGLWGPLSPSSAFNGGPFIDPHDFATIYDLNPLYSSGIDGRGQTIAVVERTTIELTDAEAFRQAFHLAPNDPNIIVNGPPASEPISEDAIEASLDTEWAGAVAPAATIDVVASASSDTTDGVVLSSIYIVDNNLADIMSVSFAACEQFLGSDNDLFNALWQQAAAQGISVFVASGDDGAAACDAGSAGPASGGVAINGLASTPFNTAVGGTQFDDTNFFQFWHLDGIDEIPDGYIPESVWNESCAATDANCLIPNLDAGGGGASILYPKPVWQSTGIPGMPNDNARDIPDVALTAAVHDSYLTCVAFFQPCTTSIFLSDQVFVDTALGVGGTSASTPSFAGIMALINQKQGGRQGLANYVLYRLAANENFANCNSSSRTDPSVTAPAGCVFNDITAGNNGVPGNDVTNNPTSGALGFPATQGYDLATGLGSVDGFNLVNAWGALTFAASTTALSATTSTSVNHGQPVTFTITVKAASGTSVPTGSVGLIAQTASPFSTGVGVGGGTLVNGSVTVNTNSLPGGQYNVIAHYAGDGNFGPSGSNPIAVNIATESSAVTIVGFDLDGVPTPSPLTFGYGLPFVVGFHVNSASGFGNPTGTVTIFDGGQQVAQVPVGNGGFTDQINCFSPGFCLGFGTHTLTATYSGDNSLAPSPVSAPFVYTITKSIPAFFEGFAINESWVGFSIQIFQNGLPIPPTGTLTVTDTFNGQTSSLKSYLLPGPSLISDFLPLVPGNHTLSTVYPGDANYLPLTIPEPIAMPALTGIPTQVTLTSLTKSAAVGQVVTLQATVTSSLSNATPTGNIRWLTATGGFLNNQQAITLTNGSATIQALLPTGTPMIAIYSGDSTFAPSSSSSIQLGASKANVAVTLSANLQTATPAEQVSVTALLTPPAGASLPEGTVQFFDSLNGGPALPFGGPQALPTNSFFPGAAQIAIPANLPLGTHVFTASYSGDYDYNPANSSISATVNVVASLPPNPVSPNFGSVAVGSTSGSQSVNVLFSASGTLSQINVSTQGMAHKDFEIVDLGSCTPGNPFSAGQSCSVDVVFAPDFPGQRLGAVLLTDASGNLLGNQYIFGLGTAPQIAFDSNAQLFNIADGTAANGSLGDPEFVAADGFGSVFIADNTNSRILKVTPEPCTSNLVTNCQSVVASSANGLGAADGVAVDGAGNVYVSDPSNNQVIMVPPGCATAACTRVIATQASGEISSPRKLAVDGAGDLFIADLNNNRVVEVPVGCTTGACQKALGTGLGEVFGVAVDGAGNIFISDFTNGQVVKLPPGCTGGPCQSIVASGLIEPRGIAVDAAGNLYVAENAQVAEISASDGSQRTLASDANLLSNTNPVDVALGPGGSLFVADPNTLHVWQLQRGDAPLLGFASTAFGTTSAPQDVMMENTGNADFNLATISPFSNSAIDPASTCTKGTVLSPGAVCTLGVEFAPVMLGNLIVSQVVLIDNTRNQTDGTQTILVIGSSGMPQSIAFPPLPNPVTFGVSPFTLAAMASSGLPVTYIVSGPASLSGSSLSILGAGVVTVTATQAGNATFSAATPVSQTITVNPASQTINFPALPNPVNFGVAPITLQATATSGLPVSYSVTGPASVSSSTLTILGGGTVTVTASQSGNANFAAAPPLTQTTVVNPAPNADFTLASSTQSLTLQLGKSGTATITLTPSGGFDSQIGFSCSQQTLVTCSFNPPTLNPSVGPITTTLTVTASAPKADRVAGVARGRWPLALGVGSCVVLTIGFLLAGIPRRRERKIRFLGALLTLFGVLVIVSLPGCGGSGSGNPTPTPTPNPTPSPTPGPQTGTVIVSASAGNGASHNLSLTITVTQ